MKHPDEFKDPTFSNLRDEQGHFHSVPEPATQQKINESDPDWQNINPDIVALCQRNGMSRGCLEEYLRGKLTWMQALETMVTLLGKELLVNQKLQVETRNEYLSIWKLQKKLEDDSKVIKLMDHSDVFNAAKQ